MRLVTAACQVGISLTSAGLLRSPQLDLLFLAHRKQGDDRSESTCVAVAPPCAKQTAIPTALTGLPEAMNITAGDIEYVVEATDFQAFVLAHRQRQIHGFISHFTISFG